MKSGDMVVLKNDRVAVQLLSDEMEKRSNMKSTLFGDTLDTTVFRRGDTATVIEINSENLARVKLFYKSCVWWGNISDLLVIG